MSWYRKAQAMTAEKFERMIQSLLPSGVKVRFEDYATGEIELVDFEVEEPFRNKGLGSEALKIIKNMASRHGVSIMLIPAGSRKRDEEEQRLRDFYERNGFQGEDALRYP